MTVCQLAPTVKNAVDQFSRRINFRGDEVGGEGGRSPGKSFNDVYQAYGTSFIITRPRIQWNDATWLTRPTS